MKCLWIHWLCDVYQCEHSKVHDSIGLDIAQSLLWNYIFLFAWYLLFIFKNMLFCKKCLVLQILCCSAKRCLVLQKDVLYCKKYIVLQKDTYFCLHHICCLSSKICCSAKNVLFCKNMLLRTLYYNVNFIVTLQHITQLKTSMAFCFVGSA